MTREAKAYIVTTTTREGHVGSIAFATLREAHGYAYRLVTNVPGYPTCIGFPTDEAVALALPETGGTIGPLPDGTTVQVKHADS